MLMPIVRQRCSSWPGYGSCLQGCQPGCSARGRQLCHNRQVCPSREHDSFPKHVELVTSEEKGTSVPGGLCTLHAGFVSEDRHTEQTPSGYSGTSGAGRSYAKDKIKSVVTQQRDSQRGEHDTMEHGIVGKETRTLTLCSWCMMRPSTRKREKETVSMVRRRADLRRQGARCKVQGVRCMVQYLYLVMKGLHNWSILESPYD